MHKEYMNTHASHHKYHYNQDRLGGGGGDFSIMYHAILLCMNHSTCVHRNADGKMVTSYMIHLDHADNMRVHYTCMHTHV